MLIDAAWLKEIRFDVLHWPGGRSIHANYKPDAFAPTTLGKR